MFVINSCPKSANIHALGHELVHCSFDLSRLSIPSSWHMYLNLHLHNTLNGPDTPWHIHINLLNYNLHITSQSCHVLTQHTSLDILTSWRIDSSNMILLPCNEESQFSLQPTEEKQLLLPLTWKNSCSGSTWKQKYILFYIIFTMNFDFAVHRCHKINKYTRSGVLVLILLWIIVTNKQMYPF